MRFARGVWILMALMAQAVMSGDAFRIVPQMRWPEAGVVSPDGAFQAAVSAKRVFLIDGKEAGVVRCEPLEGARHDRLERAGPGR